MPDFEKIKSCRSCASENLKPFFDLGNHPLANSLLSSPDEHEDFYPLSLSWCGNCSLVQLNETVDPKILFSHYVWVTGTSSAARAFADTFYKELVSRTESPKENYVLEIASNDGTFLKPFKENGYEVLGVDPAENVAEMAEKSGIPTRVVFWGKKAAEDLVSEMGKAKIVFARNVLPHVANTSDFAEGLAVALDDDGLLAVEVHYAGAILGGLQYDSIYHEHLCYFTLKSIERLLNDAGLYVFDTVMGPISGGALIVFAKKTISDKQRAMKDLENLEKSTQSQRGVNEFSRWFQFEKRVVDHKKNLLHLLNEAKREGKIVGWGASARSSTMLNFCGIGTNFIDSVIDLNPLKQGKFTAGTHIPIVPPEEAFKKNPKTIFLMAWNFRDEIMDLLKNKFNFNGKCIVPLSKEPTVINL